MSKATCLLPRPARPLPTLWIALRWLFRERQDRPLRSAIMRTAEIAAGEDLGPAAVLDAIITRYGSLLPADAILELAEALERDLPLQGLGGMVLESFRLRGERRLPS